jgi:hypothetical protein
VSPNWRWRRCPACKNVERSSDYALVGGFYARGWGQGEALRECPLCGYRAATAAFGIVREYHGVPAPLAAAATTGSVG